MTALALILMVPAGLYLVYGLVAFVRSQPLRRARVDLRKGIPAAPLVKAA